MSQIVSIDENISYLPASETPLSADVVFIRNKGVTWIFDTGSSNEAMSAVNSIEGKKCVVLSHFHPDHILNLIRIKYDELYVGKNTRKYTKSGTVIETETDFDGIKIVPLPSSHAKGSLALVYGKYAFLGDGTYAHMKIGKHTYNAQLLKAEIEVLEKLDAEFFCLSHSRKFVQPKGRVLELLKGIYANRRGNESEINVEGFFS